MKSCSLKIMTEGIAMFWRYKIELAPMFFNNDLLSITYDNQLLEIKDQTRIVHELMIQLDGKKSVAQIASNLGVDVDSVVDNVSVLNEYGLIETIKSSEDKLMTNEENRRYQVNLNYFRNFADMHTDKSEYQKKIADSKIAIIGLGGLGNLVATFAGMGVGKIVGVDYDFVELSNLNRQLFFAESDIGKLKTDALKKRINAINSNLEFLVINRKIENSHDMLDIIDGADIVVNGIDQPSILSTRWVNSACVYLDKPFVQGGLGNSDILIEAFDTGGGCFDCYLMGCMRKEPRFAKQLTNYYGELTHAVNTAFAPNVSILCGLIGMEVTKKICGFGVALTSGEALRINTNNLQYSRIREWEKQDDCPTCGRNRVKERVEPVELRELISLI